MTATDARAMALGQWRRRPNAAPLVMMTAYDYPSGMIADNAGVDIVLVGDSAAMTVLGYTTTRSVSLEEMLTLTRAVRRAVRHATLVGDLPFGTYQESDQQALATARAFIAAGCEMVKLEGAGAMLTRVQTLVEAGVPVMGHVGLLPQSAQHASELRAQGRSASDAVAIVRDAMALAAAGCMALVVEAVPAVVTAAIVERVAIPVIGIGAGSAADGQVLVYTDVLGLALPETHVARFVRRYANLYGTALLAMRAFAADVRARRYPAEAEGYGMPHGEDDELRRLLETGDKGPGTG